MAARHLPSSNLFVVRPADDKKSAVASRLESVGAVEKLTGGEDLLLLQTERASSDPEAAWQDIRNALEGTGSSVQPVLLDETGESHYPTGEVTVRFYETPTDEEIEKFAAEHNLRLRNRNRYMSQQVVFDVPAAGKCYLPRLVEEIARLDKVKNAWANTLSYYKRI
ncbi:MAG: hypothetical protein M3384_02470 [Acidobacteriota bacterium]|nr:hypothetical protein [Acidobacteriota bacterium]